MAGAATPEQNPWQLLAAHVAIQRHPAIICRLLCSSKSLRATVTAKCSGKLVVKYAAYDIQRVKEFAVWLGKHGGLLKSLQLDLNLSGKEWSEAESAIAAALQRAGATGSYCSPGLQLQTYRSYPACAGAVLQYLPDWYLKTLELGPRAEYSSTFGLEALTGLVNLSLYGDTADMLVPAVSPLTRLTKLSVYDMAAGSISKLRWVPEQLSELHLSLARIRKSEAVPPLNLTHLTALTQLSSDSKPLFIQAADRLPPSLQILRVRDCLAVGPLLGLPKLEVLEMSLSTTPAAELESISQTLTGLKQVTLCYGDMGDAAAAAAGWSRLPLRSLDFRDVEGSVSASTLQQLAKLQGLTCLDIHGGLGCCRHAGKFEATPTQFAAVLGQMTGLQELGLRGFELLPEEQKPEQPDHEQPEQPDHEQLQEDHKDGSQDYDEMNNTHGSSHSDSLLGSSIGSSSLGSSDSIGAASHGSGCSCNSSSSSSSGLATVMEAIAGLPHLNSLTFCAIYSKDSEALLPIDEEAAHQLAAATKLTSLALCDCGLNDSVVNTLASNLKSLKKLKLDCNPDLTGDVLPASVAKELSQLSELCVLRTGIRKGAEGFKARLVSLHPGLTVKSSARG